MSGRILLAAAAGLAAVALAAPSAASPAVSRDRIAREMAGRHVAVLASRQTEAEVLRFVDELVSWNDVGVERDDVAVFLSMNGWFAITIGPMSPDACKRVVGDVARAGHLPTDAFCSSGKNFIAYFTAEGRALEARIGADYFALAETPAPAPQPWAAPVAYPSAPAPASPPPAPAYPPAAAPPPVAAAVAAPVATAASGDRVSARAPAETPRDASQRFDPIDYFVPGTAAPGAFWVEPIVSDAGEQRYRLHLLAPGGTRADPADMIDVSGPEAGRLREGLVKLAEWRDVADRNRVMSYEKRAACFSDGACPDDGARAAVGASASELRFHVDAEGAAFGRIVRHKGPYQIEFDFSIESAAAFDRYLAHVIEVAEADFRARTRSDEAVDGLFN
jgi:hypothetical protein